MTVEYPLQGWRAWARSEIIQTSNQKEAKTEENTKESSFSLKDGHENKSLANSFVLFIRLPNWERGSSRKPAEIRTLRHLKNGIQVFQVKAALELSTGFPAHITSLHGVKNERFSDDTRLILGDNIKNGSSFSLQVLGAWEETVKSAWTGHLPHILYSQPSHQVKNKRTIPDAWQDFASIVEKSGKENSFCALFAASACGNTSVCKAIIKAGNVDLNQTTFFGNSCLHSAAFRGHLEIVQLLVASGSNIRCRNVDGKSPLDLAAASNFMECARWLWLNQWSISISTPDTKPSPDVRSSQETTTSLPKPSPPNLERLSGIASFHEKRKNANSPSLHERSNNQRISSRPKSTSYFKQPDKDGSLIFNKKQTVPQSSLPVHHPNTLKRPQTCFVRSSVPNPVQQKSNVLPKLLPELRASLTRERSIPSVQETRLNSQVYGHLKVDVKPRTSDKPLEVKVALNREWINPGYGNTQGVRPSSFPAASPQTLHRSISAENTESTYQQQLENTQKQKKLKFEKFSERIGHAPVEPVKVHKKIYVAMQKAIDEIAPISPNNVLDSYENLHSGSQSPRWYNNNEKISAMPDEANNSAKQSQLKHQHAEKPNSMFKSRTPIHRDTKDKTSSPVAKTDDSIVNSALLSDKPAQVKPEKSKGEVSLSMQSQKPREISMNGSTQSNKDNIMKSSIVPKSPKNDNMEQSLYAKPDHYERFKREIQTQPKENQDQQSARSREELIRREKNKTAWSEWMAAKHKEKLAQKKAEESKKNESVERKWGITYDEWVESKREDFEKKTAQKEAEKTAKKHRTNTSGKTFEDWLKEKAQEKRKENESGGQKLTEEEREKIEEARRRSFAIWSERKLEEAKKERRYSELQEKKKMEKMQDMYDKWKSKDRVMSFESWLKRKESTRTLKAVDEAQKGVQAYMVSWEAQERKELADIKFKKWLIRKESLYVQEAEQDLEEARYLREKAEQKSRIRRAMLKAKALMRLKAMSKSNPELRRIKRSSSSSTPSIAAKSIQDISTQSSNFHKRILETSVEVEEDDNDQPSSVFNFNTDPSVNSGRLRKEIVEQTPEAIVGMQVHGENVITAKQPKSAWETFSTKPNFLQLTEGDKIIEEIHTVEKIESNSDTLTEDVKKRTSRPTKKKKVKKLQNNKPKLRSKKSASSVTTQGGNNDATTVGSSAKIQAKLTRQIAKKQTEEFKNVEKKPKRPSTASVEVNKTTLLKSNVEKPIKKKVDKSKVTFGNSNENKQAEVEATFEEVEGKLIKNQARERSSSPQPPKEELKKQETSVQPATEPELQHETEINTNSNVEDSTLSVDITVPENNASTNEEVNVEQQLADAHQKKNQARERPTSSKRRKKKLKEQETLLQPTTEPEIQHVTEINTNPNVEDSTLSADIKSSDNSASTNKETDTEQQLADADQKKNKARERSSSPQRPKEELKEQETSAHPVTVAELQHVTEINTNPNDEDSKLSADIKVPDNNANMYEVDTEQQLAGAYQKKNQARERSPSPQRPKEELKQETSLQPTTEPELQHVTEINTNPNVEDNILSADIKVPDNNATTNEEVGTEQQSADADQKNNQTRERSPSLQHRQEKLKEHETSPQTATEGELQHVTEINTNPNVEDSTLLADTKSSDNSASTNEEVDTEQQLADAHQKENQAGERSPLLQRRLSMEDAVLLQNKSILEMLLNDETEEDTNNDSLNEPVLENSNKELASSANVKLPLRKITVEMPVTVMDDESDDVSCVSV